MVLLFVSDVHKQARWKVPERFGEENVGVRAGPVIVRASVRRRPWWAILVGFPFGAA